MQLQGGWISESPAASPDVQSLISYGENIVKRLGLLSAALPLAAALTAPSQSALAAATTLELVAICEGLYPPVFGVPNGEPLGVCQWDMAMINAADAAS